VKDASRRVLSLLVLLSAISAAPNRGVFTWPYTASSMPSVSASFSPPFNETVPIPLPLTVPYGYSAAASGPQSVIVLCVEFTNQNHTKTRDQINDIVFNRVNQYYREVSYNRISVTGSVSRWYQMNKTVGAYGRDSALNIDDADGDGSPDTWTLIQEAINAADRETDFSQYSQLAVLHAGPGQETSGNMNDIWSCAYLMGIWFRTKDGVSFSKAMIVPEIETQGADTVGVVAHEFAHLLGLPDLYDPYRRNDYVGKWDLMGKGLWNGNPPSSNPAHMIAWEKIRLGWVSDSQIVVVPNGIIRNVILNPFELNGTTLVVKIPITDSAYYLVELRQRIGFDMGLPDTGLLITYVDGETSGPGSVRIIDANPLTASMDDATFKPGRTFSDSTNKVYVSVQGAIEQNYRIVVNRVGMAPDLAVMKLELSPYPPRSGRMLTITSHITNQGAVVASNFTVNVYLDSNLVYTNTYTLDAGQSQFIQYTWNASSGRHTVKCIVDSAGLMSDLNRFNNEVAREFIVGSVLTVRLPWAAGSIRVNGTIYSSNGTMAIDVPVLPGQQTIEVLSEHVFCLGGRHLFVRWSDGDTSNPRTYSVAGDTTLTAEYKTQYRLTIDSGRGETSGDGWYDENKVAAANAVSPTLMSGNKTRLVFSHWSGNYTSNSATIQLTMNRPYNLTANWVVEHYLTIVSVAGSFAEQGWHGEGRTIQMRVSTPLDLGNRTRKVFASWSGDLNSESTEVTILMNAPKTITANWRTEYELRVVSDRGNPTGQGWIPAGSAARFSVEPIVNVEARVRSVFVKWTGDYEDTSNTVSVVMGGPMTVVANWKTQYMISFSVAGLPNGTSASVKVNEKWCNGTTPFSFVEWIDAGANMTLDAPLTLQSGSDQYVVEGWKNSGGQSTGSSQIVKGPLNLNLVYLKKPRGLLHILDNVYGSDNSAQLKALETARERHLTQIFAGKHWCDIFDLMCDSLTPDLPAAMNVNYALKALLQVLLYPVFRILVLSSSAYYVIGPSSEVAFFVAGFLASAFTGIVYLSPLFLLLFYVVRRWKCSFGRNLPKYVGILVVISIELITFGEMTRAPITTTIATFAFLISSACLSAATAALAMCWLVKRIRTNVKVRGVSRSPKTLMGLTPKMMIARGVR